MFQEKCTFQEISSGKLITKSFASRKWLCPKNYIFKGSYKTNHGKNVWPVYRAATNRKINKLITALTVCFHSQSWDKCCCWSFVAICLNYSYCYKVTATSVCWIHINRPVIDANLNNHHKMNKLHSALLITNEWVYLVHPFFFKNKILTTMAPNTRLTQLVSNMFSDLISSIYTTVHTTELSAILIIPMHHWC